MSGRVASSGNALINPRPTSVAWICFPVRSKNPRLNSNSMIPARVASVPKPSVSFRIFLIVADDTYREMPVMAANNVASVKYGGGVVFFSINSPRSQCNIWPFTNSGNVFSGFFASSFWYSTFHPSLRMDLAVATNTPPSMTICARVSAYS